MPDGKYADPVMPLITLPMFPRPSVVSCDGAIFDGGTIGMVRPMSEYTVTVGEQGTPVAVEVQTVTVAPPTG